MPAQINEQDGNGSNGAREYRDGPPSEYEDFAARLSADARVTEKKWLENMSPDEKRKFHELGLDKEPDDYEVESNRGEEDAADWDDASADAPDFPDKLSDKLREQFSLTSEQALKIAAWHIGALEKKATSYRAFLLQRVIAGFLRPGNVKLRSYGLAFAADLAALNKLGTMTQAGREIGLSRASVSKSANEWCDLLEFPRSKHMKSQESRAEFSKAQKNDHWRRRKFKRTTNQVKEKI